MSIGQSKHPKPHFENGGQRLHKHACGFSQLADLIERDAVDLASLESIDAGILYGESLQFNVPQAVDTLRYFAGWADKGAGQSLHIPDGLAYTQHEPLGICAAIVPWNAPLYVYQSPLILDHANMVLTSMITIWKLAPAIATGNVLIIKTPELTPSMVKSSPP